MAESETYAKGRELRRQLLGEAYVERVDTTTYSDPIMRKFIKRRDGVDLRHHLDAARLDLKTRSSSL